KFNSLALLMASSWQQNNKKPEDRETLLNLVNKRFSLSSGSLRSGIDAESLKFDTVGDTFDFYGRVKDSFLPHILEMARERNISLVFIRVQERPTEQGARPDPPELKKYMADLRNYLADSGAALYDFTGDPELPLSAYNDGDHIKDQKKYTELFYRRVGDYLK
ncbi:MAG: hypothetical protein OEM01_09405, partial [Desulfobulbaceae bacterium]|nr:hypothetical protein [Desulfobulbaceae bacterium]